MIVEELLSHTCDLQVVSIIKSDRLIERDEFGIQFVCGCKADYIERSLFYGRNKETKSDLYNELYKSISKMKVTECFVTHNILVIEVE